MQEIVVNRDFGGFAVSETAARRMAEWGSVHAQHAIAEYDRKCAGESLTDLEQRYGVKWHGYLHEPGEIRRDDPHLVRVVRELGDQASDELASLAVVEIPDDVDWVIEEYDGSEWIAEKHRTWS